MVELGPAIWQEYQGNECHERGRIRRGLEGDEGEIKKRIGRKLEGDEREMRGR